MIFLHYAPTRPWNRRAGRRAIQLGAHVDVMQLVEDIVTTLHPCKVASFVKLQLNSCSCPALALVTLGAQSVGRGILSVSILLFHYCVRCCSCECVFGDICLRC